MSEDADRVVVVEEDRDGNRIPYVCDHMCGPVPEPEDKKEAEEYIQSLDIPEFPPP
jgi:hypothetical protein